ncbi:DNA-3-methyladenine glycosylase [Streptomyces durbertensis]|uniref:Putative 3-methyladenine DNA glycosylase n=1 Tax=Streptomyces durbertensis TaxID=2448886 RepID=A0ABR6ELU7_9ACTN|nr:DNA-3-methyladenine glycosylase [Streptomyces durbertensis]MBB1246296.1 DNA-3-methyladenine glycosylase [Streptomyces durbertensis]
MISGRDRTALPRTFFDRPVLDVAPDLLGRILVRTTPRGRIALRLTEVEAYDGERDPGSHAYRGRTARNAAMFGPPGHAYVYFTYGMWHCLNLVCGPEGKASGVLLRAGEIVSGLELARAHRPNARRDTELAKGPARLATALDVDRALNAVNVCLAESDGEALEATEPDGELGVLAGRPPARRHIRTGPRTGVGGEGAPYPWRFWIGDDPTVSPYRAHQPRSRARLKTEAT